MLSRGIEVHLCDRACTHLTCTICDAGVHIAPPPRFADRCCTASACRIRHSDARHDQIYLVIPGQACLQLRSLSEQVGTQLFSTRLKRARDFAGGEARWARARQRNNQRALSKTPRHRGTAENMALRTEVRARSGADRPAKRRCQAEPRPAVERASQQRDIAEWRGCAERPNAEERNSNPHARGRCLLISCALALDALIADHDRSAPQRDALSEQAAAHVGLCCSTDPA